MTDKDPKDMTASELLRWAANSERDRWSNYTPHGKLISAMAGEDYCTIDIYAKREAVSALADKIDAELAQARKESLRQGAELWAKANGWPDFREGEDFGAWLDRCALPRPRFEDGEPVQFGDDTDKLHGVEKFIFTRSCGGSCQMQDADGNICNVFNGKRAKRPAPEALGADGLPIEAGGTVWDTKSGLEITVSRITKDDGDNVIVCANGDICELQFYPYDLTHTPPDTLERLRDDIAEWRADCAKPGSGWDVKTAEWAARIDAIIRRTGGAE